MRHATNSLTARDVMLIADNISKAGLQLGLRLSEPRIGDSLR
jgi:hypothetical protein